MARVAIIGSCITRDLWPIRGDALQNVHYVSRTSLPSLFSPSVEGFRPHDEKPEALARHQHNALVADLRKSALGALLAFAPTHLIFDFIDERFDLLGVGRSLITDSWELRVSGYLSQGALGSAYPIPRLSRTCDRLWREAAGELAAFIRATPLADARMILHSAQWAYESRGPQGSLSPIRNTETLTGRPADIGAYNAMLAGYEAAFEAVMPPMARVEAAAWRIADEGHRWGLSPFHYVPEYYDEIWRQLEPLGVEPISPGPAGPSAPAG